jgi:hypothetical protein
MFQITEKNILFSWRFPPHLRKGEIRRREERQERPKWELLVALGFNKVNKALQSVLAMLATSQWHSTLHAPN